MTPEPVILRGDCLDQLKGLADNSVDALVTDPPAGISFMGKAWDDDKGGRDAWVSWLSEVMHEALRVLKPGAHGLVWSIPRTSHWTGTALEQAGFEVRDCVTHLFGSGFPKSLDISKAIDKALGLEGPVIGRNPAYRIRQLEHDAKWKTSMRPEFKRGPATDAAKQWNGWGTALKPACEIWWLVRKPISEKTVAANVLKWGCGGINIDAARIYTKDVMQSGRHVQANRTFPSGYTDTNRTEYAQNALGRFPANLVLSHSPNCTDEACDMFDCPVAQLDEQSGVLKTGNGPVKRSGLGFHGAEGNMNECPRPANAGGASRFFYVAKPSSSERNTGCDGLPERVTTDGRGKPIDNPFLRGETARINSHPTVKPIKLMRYLIKLITPPNGTVLDPFLGSGTTGCAAALEGFNFIGIEREAEYAEIATRRIEHYVHSRGVSSNG